MQPTLDLSTVFGPLIQDALVWLFTALFAVAGTYFASAQRAIKAKTGLDIEALARESLHKALETGVTSAYAPDATADQIIADAISHAKASAPDAIKKLGAPDGILANIAKAKLQRLILGAVK